ncbi:Signal transducer regulating beta-lactamase production, contains metallopeptidase domain [Dyella sp. OK004]|uniref:M56 family metallopeptidase n=1 Tax=Dyella sp. OK004 TaxID=1855292 RepID=UPI0008E1429F|nr:M56 family metallopeptidase [Dyella sp. OK004]SFS06173.1 Signal transducer regulating beta-lactamase production, contains metallopeptidase domain [Dyella sp. OK004]
MTSSEWMSRLWLLQLAFTLAVMAVLLLRRPCRRWLGAERSFQLWMLPPLAMLMSQLPHSTAHAAASPTFVLTIATAGGAFPVVPQATVSFDWRTAVVAVWLIGMLAVGVLGWFVQSRYRRRLRSATLEPGLSHWPILVAVEPGLGPALVGAWRPHIVLPADFATRYDQRERALILAHEEAHARRRDGLWSLCAIAVVAVCWPHTLAWLGWRLFRQDQELACDAAVMRDHHGYRRQYAQAMLKTLSEASALPVGCAWSPRHPLTERIAMLKEKPSLTRHRLGGFVVALCVSTLAGMVYAATPVASEGNNSPSSHYSLKMDVAYNGEAPETHFTQCLKPGEYATINGSATGIPAWSGRFMVVPAEGGQLEIQGDLSGGTLKEAVHPKVRNPSGQTATIEVGEVHQGDAKSGRSIRIDVTARLGC